MLVWLLTEHSGHTTDPVSYAINSSKLVVPTVTNTLLSISHVHVHVPHRCSTNSATVCTHITYHFFTFRKPLILCVEKQLIGEHLEEILDKGTCLHMSILHGRYLQYAYMYNVCTVIQCTYQCISPLLCCLFSRI